MNRAACWGVYGLQLALQRRTRGNPTLEPAYQQQTRLLDRFPWRLLKSMLDNCLASGDRHSAALLPRRRHEPSCTRSPLFFRMQRNM